MSDLFERLAARALEADAPIRPRTPSLFEPRAGEPLGGGVDEVSAAHDADGARRGVAQASARGRGAVSAAGAASREPPASTAAPSAAAAAALRRSAPASASPDGSAPRVDAVTASLAPAARSRSSSTIAPWHTAPPPGALRPAPLTAAPLPPIDRRPEIRVTIGRIDVRAPAARPRPAPPPPRPAPTAPPPPRPATPPAASLSLADYLAQRRGGAR